LIIEKNINLTFSVPEDYCSKGGICVHTDSPNPFTKIEKQIENIGRKR
jgi:hypothetical protein